MKRSPKIERVTAIIRLRIVKATALPERIEPTELKNKNPVRRKRKLRSSLKLFSKDLCIKVAKA